MSWYKLLVGLERPIYIDSLMASVYGFSLGDSVYQTKHNKFYVFLCREIPINPRLLKVVKDQDGLGMYFVINEKNTFSRGSKEHALDMRNLFISLLDAGASIKEACEDIGIKTSIVRSWKHYHVDFKEALLKRGV